MGSLIKPKRIIDRKKRRWIKTHGCLLFRPVREGCECAGEIDPHHVIPVSLGGTDDTLVPLCRKHHDEANRREWFERKYDIDLLSTAERFSKLYLREVGVKRERPPTLKSRLSVGFNVRNCPACLKGHTLALSKVDFDNKEYACPVKGKRVGY